MILIEIIHKLLKGSCGRKGRKETHPPPPFTPSPLPFFLALSSSNSRLSIYKTVCTHQGGVRRRLSQPLHFSSLFCFPLHSALIYNESNPETPLPSPPPLPHYDIFSSLKLNQPSLPPDD